MANKKRHVNSTSENGRSRQSSSTTSHSKGSRKKDRENGHANGNIKSSSEPVTITYIVLVLALASICGILHRKHIAYMFESDRHFSHLSSLERELAFRTEMGLYYSYYKTIITSDSFGDGLNQIMYDNVTEYGQTINTLKRFNLYPEVVVGLLFRTFESVAANFNYKTKVCWKVNRGNGMSSVSSCEGLGDPAYFYVENVFFLNGINMAIFFLFATYLSGSVFGGMLAVGSFFFNHGECTRVQWTPPLRESFAYPFLVLQMFLVTYTLRCSRPRYLFHSVAIAISTASFMLPWQFAQFTLMTQTVAVFGTYVLKFIGSHKLNVILAGQTLGLAISYISLFGNEMLLTSFFASCLLTVALIVLLEPLLEKLHFRLIIWIVQVAMLAVGTVGVKLGVTKLLQIVDDKHISDIFKSKFTNFANFHTMLYTCAAEFDFMEKETPVRILKTLLLPSAVISIIGFTLTILGREYALYKASKKQPVVNGRNHGDHNDNEESSDIQHRSKPHAEILYNLFQLIAYTAMAVIIMRLKLFWTPHMCLITSLLASKEIFGWIGKRSIQIAVVMGIFAAMSYGGYNNLKHQWSIQGEFSNYPLEQMLEWINQNTVKDAVFAGPMPTMATVKLCTYRPIVNHPHYEDAGLRERTKKVYTMYSRKPAAEVWQNLRDLKANYTILEESWCIRRSKRGCGMAEIWDLEDKVNTEATPICKKLHDNEGPYFKRVFRNKVYDILKVLEKPSKR